MIITDHDFSKMLERKDRIIAKLRHQRRLANSALYGMNQAPKQWTIEKHRERMSRIINYAGRYTQQYITQNRTR